MNVTFTTSVQWDDFDRLIRASKPEARRIAIDTTVLVLTTAQQNAPVDTGELKASGYAREESETSFIVGFRAQHGHFVNFGTRFMAPNPFFTTAFELGRNQFEAWIADFFQNVTT
jgi:HK97 gp10 family phage protein